ncbi:acetyl-CoA C-acyltransferase [Vitiosangium sp. GDMCC 1.1324]|uniref:acetyl-CoA C-acyltransferase n=1 Tax=Vitiosangium sp. (strain GDMCC 1.1324) TaxID=2138576 RepID=UPI000D3AD124|nr:acetyl-CoA C-acyltransferase [Vitiosangium sp. GDMCC 1.1324]PTL84098.1 acetyl-CoA C-acyltransferase [Vitiosangium sp. GDMCC 1.1324]
MDAFIVDAVRTPRARAKPGKGALSALHPQELLAQTLQQLPLRTGVDVTDVDDVVIGSVAQINEQGANIARNAVLAAGWPISVPGFSLNRFCGSGLQALAVAAMGVASGAQRLVVAGGVEQMSRLGLGADGGGTDGGNTHLRRRFFQVPQGISADLIATREGFSRQDLDAFGLRSQQLAVQAQAEGRFSRGLFPVKHPDTGEVLLATDDHPRRDTTLEKLAALPASFTQLGAQPAGPNGETLDELALSAYPRTPAVHHLHTAGTSSGIADGAAALLVASGDYVRAHGLKARARVRAVTTVGSDPILMLTAPAPAAIKALKAAGMGVRDVDLWEINEAFAAVVLQTARTLELDLERVNVNGGAIALGHPLGATGSVLVGTALDELERRGKTVAVVVLCTSGGQAVAAVLERV